MNADWHPWRDLHFAPGPAAALAYPADAERFHVEELPLYPASGEGEHLYLDIEKRDIDTPRLAGLIADRLGLSPGSVGWAGRKDSRATARQRLSVPREGSEGRLDLLADPRFRVLSAQLHRNKLRLGHLAGNRFRLFLRGEAEPAAFAAGLERLRAEGMPNYFGPQRFGADGDNHRRGRQALAAAGQRKGRAQEFLFSAYQAALFNRVCAARQGEAAALAEGDLAYIHGHGAVFPVLDAQAEAPRAARLEISATGPLPGKRMLAPQGEPGRLESELLAAGGWEPGFAARLRGGRRPLRVPVGELQASAGEGGLWVAFTLPPGCYASVLLACLGLGVPAAAPGEAD
jgi:tRNA pseudouridine13 synthase